MKFQGTMPILGHFQANGAEWGAFEKYGFA